MKKLMMLAAVAVFAMPLALMGAKEKVGGYTWKYYTKGGGAIIGIYGLECAFCEGAAISPLPTGELAIPAKLGGKPVIGIADYAFLDCTDLTAVTVHADVKSIGENAFMGCSGLQNLTLPTWCETFREVSPYGAFEEEVDIIDWIFGYGVPEGLEVVYRDVGGGTSGGGAVPEAWKKARTLKGRATRALPPPNDLQGVIEIKCGKAGKTGLAKISATLTGMDGKKRNYKAKTVDVTGKTVKVDFDGLSVIIDGDSFTGGDGLSGGLSVASAVVGGALKGAQGTFSLEGFALAGIGEIQDDLLPDSVPFDVVNGKWKFAKNTTVKLSKDKTKVEWDTSKGKTNLSGLKLTYTPKTGLFKGSFKVYALEGSGKATKLKKYTVNVTGVVVDGVGYGKATCKKPVGGPWPVTVK